MIEHTKLYHVVISGGEIDNKKVSDYEDFFKSVGYTHGGIDKTVSLNKSKAYVRWHNVAMALQKGADSLFNVESNGKIDSVASSIEFDIYYTQPDGLWVEVDPQNYVEGDEEIVKLRDGRVIYKGIKAIKQLIKNACCEDSMAYIEFWNPEYDNTGDENATGKPSDMPFGWQTIYDVVEASTPEVSVEEKLADVDYKAFLKQE